MSSVALATSDRQVRNIAITADKRECGRVVRVAVAFYETRLVPVFDMSVDANVLEMELQLSMTDSQSTQPAGNVPKGLDNCRCL